MFSIILGGILGFAVGNLAGALFAPLGGSRPIDAIRRRLDQAGADAGRAADAAAQSIRDRYDRVKHD